MHDGRHTSSTTAGSRVRTRYFLVVVGVVLLASGVWAAEIGEECKTGPNVAQEYVCPVGTSCLKAIGNKYCSNLGMICGWPGKGGYTLGTKKEYNGKEYVCTATGFKLSAGETCSSGSQCGSGLCLKAIGNKYCSNLGMICGWPNTGGYILGTKKEYGGKLYECFSDGFKEDQTLAGLPTEYANLCKQSCGTNASCRGQCKRDYDLYMTWIGQMSSGVSTYRLPDRYVKAIGSHYSGISLANWRFGYSPRQDANNATTDCDKTYFNDQEWVGRMRNSNVIGDSKIHWMLHEIAHYEQCRSWGGRYQYIHTWWTQERAAQGGQLDMWAIHDTMPMENQADDRANQVLDALEDCCLSGKGAQATINYPLRITGFKGVLDHTLPKSGTLEFDLLITLTSGPADVTVAWTFDSDPVSALSWASTLDQGRRVRITNPPQGRYTIRIEAMYAGRTIAQARSRPGRLVIRASR